MLVVNAAAHVADIANAPHLDETSLSQCEKRRLWLLIFAFCLATTLPYAWAYFITPPGFVYSGLLFSPDDQNAHLMWARQSAEGHFFAHDLFTTEHLSSGEKPLFNNLLTTLIGALSRLPGVSLIVAYHLVRLAAGALCLWWFYLLAAQLTDNIKIRFFATALAAFSSGGGWLKDSLGEVVPFFAARIWMDRPDNANFPMMPEGFAFPSLFIFPLNAASLALLCLVYLCILRAQNGERRALFIGGGAAFLLSNIHTYDALPLGATLLLWAVVSGLKNKKQAIAPLVIALGALPPLLYQLYVFQNSSEFQSKAITRTAPPPLPDVLLSYAPLLLLALWGAWQMRQHFQARLLMLWAIVTLVSLYAPLSFSRKMIEGFHLPLCFFAAVAIIEASKNCAPLKQRLAALSVGALLCLSSLQFVLWCLNDAPQSIVPYRGAMPPLYLAQSDGAALQWLQEQNEQRPGAVLSLSLIGNYIPQKTGWHAYLGHWAETLNFDAKQNEVYAFYQGQMPRDEALTWLRKNHIRYVLFGFYEAGVFPSDNNIKNLLGEPVFQAPPSPSAGATLPPAKIYKVP